MKIKIRKILSILCATIIFLCSLSEYVTYADEEETIYILIESGTKITVEEKNSNQRVNAGYLTKLMSLLLIAEDIETGKYSLDTELIASQNVQVTKGAVIWLEPGDKLVADELLKAVIVGNANDALTVLVEKSERSIENFVSRMNSKAFDLGLRNTAFYNPYGYYDEREYTTAHDIAIISSELIKYKFLEGYFKTWRDFIKSGQTELVNENTLSRTYDKHIGFKATHTEQSGYCISEGAVGDDGTSYICVVLGAGDEDVMFSTAKKILKKGFTDYKVTVPGFLDELMRPIQVRNGVNSAVELCLKNYSSVIVPKGITELSNVIIVPEYIIAPVDKGQKIGTAGFYNGKNLVYETDIITKENVDKLTFGYVFKKILLKIIEK